MLNPQSKEATPAFYQRWMTRIQEACTREKTYRKDAKHVVDLYEAKDSGADSPYAIVYSNTEVLAPSVYNSRPIPLVVRRYKDEDPIGKAVAEVSTRTLKYLIDTEAQDYDSFDDNMQAAVLDGLLTNRGLTRFKFVGSERGLAECVYGEPVRWDKFFHEYARSWKKVPWIGFEWDMVEAEIRKNFSEITFETGAFSSFSEEENPTGESKEQLTGVTVFKVFEIWDKVSKKVYFFSPCYTKGALKVVDDPLGISGFYPIPRPLNFMRKTTTLVPTPLYTHYKAMAQELNDVTKRLRAIIRAVRYRGAYNSTVEGIEKMLNAEDNELVPIENMASLPDNVGIDRLLYIVPVQELATTAQALYQQREQVKSVIYEITGISDILRGASVASETATAQQIKNQWGTLRLKKMQKEVQRYCRDSLAIMLEIAAAHFEPTTVKQMTGLPYLFQEDVTNIQAKIAEQQAQASVPQLPGAPAPQPVQIPPQVQQLLTQPTWEQIFQIFQSDIALHYKCDIETNSTIDAEAAQDKQDISELLNALSQWLNGLAPLVEKGFLPFDIAKNMLLAISRRFNFGSQLEDALSSMTEPKPQADPNAAAEAEMKKAEMAAKTQEFQMKMELSKQTFANEQALMQAEVEMKKAELAIKQAELELQKEGLAMKLQAQREQHRIKMLGLASKVALETPAHEKAEKEPA